jgi:nicotinamidase-related amidase
MNSDFVTNTDRADVIYVGGQALSHCVANTIDDLIKEFGPDSTKKIVILSDCCSNVPGFEQNGDDFLARVQAAGVRVQKSTEVFA